MDQEQKSYKFMKEVIKKKKIDRKGICIRIAVFFASAVLFGVVAAIAFTIAEPRADRAINGEEQGVRVDLSNDEEPTPTPEPSEVSETQTAVSSQSQETETQTDGQQENGTAMGLAEYQSLYTDMLEIAETPKRAIVTVIGITSQMDYFNQNYESRQQISGLLVAQNGQDLYILTEYRVVENVERIQVTFWDGKMIDATYQKHDPATGLTVLKASAEDLEQSTRDGMEIAPLGNSYTVKQGEPILALGSPMGYSDAVAFGVVTSVTNRISTIDTEYSLLTTDIIGTQAGSGILVNLEGEIVGVIAQSYSLGENIVTGVAISQVKELIENLIANAQLPYIGIKGQDVTSDIADKNGIPKGVLIDQVQQDSPAMLSGLKEYDVIVKFGEEKVSTLKQYHDKLIRCSPGQNIKVTAMRRGAEGYAEMEFNLTIGGN